MFAVVAWEVWRVESWMMSAEEEVQRCKRLHDTWLLLIHELRKGTRIAVKTWARQHGLTPVTLRAWLDYIQTDTELRVWVPLVRDKQLRYVVAWAVDDSDVCEEE